MCIRDRSSFEPHPRYVTNYVGLSGRLGILSEAYSYAPFDERIRATDLFVRAALDRLAFDADRVRQMVDDAARSRPATFALATDFAPPSVRPILLDSASEEINPYSGLMMLRRTGRPRPTPMPVRDAFVATATAPTPVAYLVPDTMRAVFDRLAIHGVASEPAAGSYEVDRFRVDSMRVSPRAFQNVRARRIWGHDERARVDGTGYRIVRCTDGTCRLAAALLDPRAPDGFTTWALFDGFLTAQPTHPVLRVVR